MRISLGLALSDGSGRFLAGALMLMMAGVSGCRSGSQGAAGTVSAHEGGTVEAARQQMELIPPPSKNRYMAIRSIASWENPYLTVQGEMVTLHVLLADANTSGLGEGTMLRPVGARRQDLNVRLSDLPAALNAVPQSAFPYGRVVAVEEAKNTPVSAQPQVRRNMELAVGMLNELGVVVYEMGEGGAGLR